MDEYKIILDIINKKKEIIIKYLTTSNYIYNIKEKYEDKEYIIKESKDISSPSEWDDFIKNTESSNINIELISKSENKIQKLIDDKKIIKTNNNFFYSSYGNNKKNIIEKELVWCSQILSQSLLHQFNKPRTRDIDSIQPIIYRFKIKNVFVLVSSDKNNETIFNILLKPIINDIKNIYISEENESEIFKGDNNKRILYILKALNTIICDLGISICGYYNYYDQDEYALLNSPDLIYDLDESKITQILYYNNEDNIDETFIFPVLKKDFIKIATDGTRYTDLNIKDPRNIDVTKYRMVCNYLKTIYYQNFDDKTRDDEYNCSDYENSSYFEKKYLKYKKKYLILRKKLFI